MKKYLLYAFTISAFATLELSEESIHFYNEGKYEKAIKEILESEDRDIKSYLNLAIIYKDLALYDEAIRLLENLGPTHREAKILLAKLYYLNCQPEKAIALLREYQDKDAILYLGLSSEDLGNLSEAKRYYLKVIETDKNNIIALLRLAKIYEKEKDLKRAIELYERIKALDPSIIQVNRRLADLYLRIGDPLNSYRAYAKAIAIEPKDLELKKRLDFVKKRLPSDFFEEEKKKKDLLRREIFFSVKPLEEISGCPEVRVKILKSDSFSFKCGSDFEIKEKKRNSVFRGEENSIYKINLDRKRKKISLKDEEKNLLEIFDLPILIKPIKNSETICIFDIPIGEGQFWARRENRCFRGELKVNLTGNKLSLINILNLEEYLYGVLPAEIPYDSPIEALKAQSIVARTQALKKIGRHKKEGFDFCSDVHCQVYGGAGVERENTNRAVDETRGLVITFKGLLIDSLYSANCGGHTQGNIFGFGGEVPYLQATLDSDRDVELNFPLSPLELENYLLNRPDTFCGSEKSSFRWIRIYEKTELEKILNIDKIFKIIPLKRSISGHVRSIKIIGKEEKEIVGELNIRKALGGLRSSLFKIETKFNKNREPEFFIFYGGGFGHGVGLCQEGAIGMAKKGKDFLEIINHYFSETEIMKLYGEP